MTISNLIRVGVNTSGHIGIDEKTREGPLRQILARQYACGINLEEAIASGNAYHFKKGREEGDVQAVYQPCAIIPSRTALDSSYEQSMKVGITGKDHLAEWMFGQWLFKSADGNIYAAGINPQVFEALLRKHGLVQLADLGFNPVYHVIATPNGTNGNPLENGNLRISAEYPIELGSYFLWEHRPTPLTQGTPLTLKFIYQRTGEERVVQNNVPARDRKVVEILVTTGKTEYAGGIIADTTQTGGSLVGQKYTPLLVIGSSTPLVVANASLERDCPKFTSSLKKVCEKATETARETYPKMFERRFEKAFDNAPDLIRDYERLVVSVSNGNGHLPEELFNDARQLSFALR